jgi:uncharacterized repeat protein (TIGR03803 family)
MQGKKSSLRLTAVLAILGATSLITGIPAAAQETVLYEFSGESDGGYPFANLVFDPSGNLYGTTSGGGTGCGGVGCGTVFELSPQAGGGWNESVLYSFDYPPSYGILTGVVRDTAGNLYGTTINGGDYNFGTVYELTPSAGGVWMEQVLYSFGNQRDGALDGAFPWAGLTLDADGNLYGTTTAGGAFQQGIAFELIPKAGGSWTEKILHSFSGGKDGSQPYAGLTFDAAGNLYGTTAFGGIDNGGTVFKLSPNSSGEWSEKILQSFVVTSTECHCFPYTRVILDQAGNLYGTLSGVYNGSVFELMPTVDGNWTAEIVHNFSSSSGIRTEPSGLILDAAGNLYGTSSSGGTYEEGTVFELTPSPDGSWKEKLLYSFDSSGTGGYSPRDSLIFDAVGNLYGTTSAGGTRAGTVFKIAH